MNNTKRKFWIVSLVAVFVFGLPLDLAFSQETPAAKNAEAIRALQNAAEQGDFETIKKILSPPGSDYKRWNITPLHRASKHGLLDVVKFLVGRGEKIMAVNRIDGSTPLYEAAQFGHLDIVDYLIRQGANLNAANESGS